jgi:hypothetical protein
MDARDRLPKVLAQRVAAGIAVRRQKGFRHGAERSHLRRRHKHGIAPCQQTSYCTMPCRAWCTTTILFNRPSVRSRTSLSVVHAHGQRMDVCTHACKGVCV